MKDKDWNPEDWQGRRKDQVEFAERIIAGCFIGTIIIVAGLLISKWLF